MAKRVFEDDADFVVVGTGAGGATAARVLTAAGRSVILLDEGPRLRAEERPRELLDAMTQSFRDFGTQTTSGTRPIVLLQGRLVGGSTAINSGIIWRMPDDVREVWTREHGLGDLVEERAMSAAFDAIERDLGVAETESVVLGGNAERMEQAARALGLPGRVIRRNTIGCVGRAECLQGCPGEARQSMDVSYVPKAIAAGARLHDMSRADRVRIEGGRASGVDGTVLERGTRRVLGRFRVSARRGVIVSASAVHSPALLARSGVRGAVGESFRAHPGAAVVGRFDETIGMSRGATQSYEVPMRDRGWKLESLSLPPETLAARLPGVGAEWQERLAALDHFAQWCALVRMNAVGSVRPAWGGGSEVRYVPLASDLERLRSAVALLARMMFAAGAKEVYPGVACLPEVMRDPRDVELIERANVRQEDFHLMASHLFGGACAGADPDQSAVGPWLESHAVRDLYVMDGSVFPTNLGVNPQHSIMAVVWRAAERLAQKDHVRMTA